VEGDCYGPPLPTGILFLEPFASIFLVHL